MKLACVTYDASTRLPTPREYLQYTLDYRHTNANCDSFCDFRGAFTSTTHLTTHRFTLWHHTSRGPKQGQQKALSGALTSTSRIQHRRHPSRKQGINGSNTIKDASRGTLTSTIPHARFLKPERLRRCCSRKTHPSVSLRGNVPTVKHVLHIQL